MRSPATTMRKWAMAGGVALALFATSTTTADAGAVATVLGTVDCDPQTGEQLITWRWTNNASEVLDFESGAADGTALTAGSIVSPVVGMQPALGLALQAEAVGETVATPDAVGTVDVSLVWFRTQTQLPLTVVGSVLLFGDCALPPDTTAAPDTTIPVTDPTVIATAPQTTTAVGSGGGSLPHAGSDDTLLYLGGGLVMIGVSLLVVRRRSYLTD